MNMTFNYRPFLTAMIVAACLVPAQAQAQSGDTLVVEWANASGETIINALRDAIESDTNPPPGRVYKLRRGGLYWNTERIQ